MCSRVYLLDGGETVGIYSEVEHEVLKTQLKPWPTLKTQLSPSSTPHSRGGFAPAPRRSLRQSPWPFCAAYSAGLMSSSCGLPVDLETSAPPAIKAFESAGAQQEGCEDDFTGHF